MFDYVDEKHRICMFGYGAIDTGIIGSTIVFKGIKPPQGAGTQIWNEDCTAKIGNWEYTGSTLYMHIRSMNDISIIENHIKTIEENHGGSFDFDNITMDFSHYSEDSIRVFKSAVMGVYYYMLRLIAC